MHGLVCGCADGGGSSTSSNEWQLWFCRFGCQKRWKEKEMKFIWTLYKLLNVEMARVSEFIGEVILKINLIRDVKPARNLSRIASVSLSHIRHHQTWIYFVLSSWIRTFNICQHKHFAILSGSLDCTSFAANLTSMLSYRRSPGKRLLNSNSIIRWRFI